MLIHARSRLPHNRYTLTQSKHVSVYIAVRWRRRSHCFISLSHLPYAKSSLTSEELSQICSQLFLPGKRSLHRNQAPAAIGWDILQGRPLLDEVTFALPFVPPGAAYWRPDSLVGVNDMSALELVQFWQAHDGGCMFGGLACRLLWWRWSVKELEMGY
jgi:hypothetical protein